jgi:hypothetical protein
VEADDGKHVVSVPFGGEQDHAAGRKKREKFPRFNLIGDFLLRLEIESR